MRTDENTYIFLADLRNATQIVESRGKDFVILPDCAVFWMSSIQRNPISCDWPQNTELGSEHLVERIEADLSNLRGDIVIIVQRVQASSLSDGFVELPEEYKIVQYVKSNFVNTGETEFFILYE